MEQQVIYTDHEKQSEGLRLLREQLELFSPDSAESNIVFSEEKTDDKWDFASANTKTETHCFHPYPAMMIPQIARELIRMFASEHQVLLDPFCGSGTALVEAKMAGLNSWGIDINPLARLIAQVKTIPIEISRLKHKALELWESCTRTSHQIEKSQLSIDVPDFYNMNYWFKPAVSKLLALLREHIFAIEESSLKEFFLVAFSETVREVSNTRNNEFKLFRIPEEELATYNPDVLQIFFSKVYRNLSGMADFLRKAKTGIWTTILDEDTRYRTSIPQETVNIVVTSPPYGDSRTTVAYGQFSRLSLQWLGLEWEEARKIDDRSLGGKRPSTFDGSCPSDALWETVSLIKQIDQKRALEVYGFFVDLFTCMKEIYRVSTKQAKMCFVIGNRTVKGIQIPTDQIMIEFGQNLGLHHLETIHRKIPNKRMPLKNSPSNVRGSVGDTMTREHIVILEKE